MFFFKSILTIGQESKIVNNIAKQIIQWHNMYNIGQVKIYYRWTNILYILLESIHMIYFDSFPSSSSSQIFHIL